MTTQYTVITGAGSGIGKFLVQEQLNHTNVLAIDKNPEALQNLKDESQDSKGQLKTIVVDLSEPHEVKQVLANGFDETSHITGLINCAGIYPAIEFFDTKWSDWFQIMNTNAGSMFFWTQQLAERAKELKHAFNVVNISSGAYSRARTGASIYCASKAAVNMITKACAVELAAYGFRVNAVAPGFIRVNSKVNPVTTQYEELAAENPLGKIGEPRDLWGAVNHLLQGESQWTTGVILDVDGGAIAGTNQLPLHWNNNTEKGHDE